MTCKNCQGTGESPVNPNLPCIICDGSGSLCDVCGESCDTGLDLCPSCDASMSGD